MSEFFEAIWHGEGIGDGGDLEEALQSFVAVKPDDDDWVAACAVDGASPMWNALPRLMRISITRMPWKPFRFRLK